MLNGGSSNVGMLHDSNFSIAANFPCTKFTSRVKTMLAHNTARAAVGVRNIVWDNTLAAYAQNYANQRIGDCSLVHSGGPYGENLAWGGGNFLTATGAVQMWVNEKTNYNYNTNTYAPGKVCGHYTQVVWANSVRIGCARVQCNNNAGVFIICSYICSPW